MDFKTAGVWGGGEGLGLEDGEFRVRGLGVSGVTGLGLRVEGFALR